MFWDNKEKEAKGTERTKSRKERTTPRKPKKRYQKSTTVLHRKYPAKYTISGKTGVYARTTARLYQDIQPSAIWPAKLSATSKNGRKNEYSHISILRHFSSGIIYQNPALFPLSHKFRPFTIFFQKNRKYFKPGNFCRFSRKRRLDTFRECSPVDYSYVANSQPALALVPAPCTLHTAHCTCTLHTAYCILHTAVRKTYPVTEASLVSSLS